ncbi:MAG: hypothetical protein ABEJ06_02875 [Haloarculaceae archaeon]
MTLLTYITVMMTVTLVCGALITTLAFRAYLRTGIPALRALAVGLGLVTVGGVIAGGAHQFTAIDVTLGIGIQSTFTALGFAVIAYSLYAEDTTRYGFD